MCEKPTMVPLNSCVVLLNPTIAPKDLEPFHDLGIDAWRLQRTRSTDD